MLRSIRATARVLLSGAAVGTIYFKSGGSEFRYSDDLLDPGHRVLGQLFEQDPRALYRERTGLPSWFANLLPESGSGLRRYYAARFGSTVVDDARLLLTLGDDLPGAVTVEAEDVPDDGPIVERAEARRDEAGVHLSALAGAQLKMSVLRDGERLTLPTGNETGRWIAKFPDILHQGLAENEFLMMRWARAAGIDAPEAELVPSVSVPDVFGRHMPPQAPVYVVARFDRCPDGARIHMEDLAQVQGVPPVLRDHGADYDGIGRLLHVLAGREAFDEYVRRVVAMVLMGNEDAHLKNWSVWYPDGRSTGLAPAYDLVCTTFYDHLARGLVFPLGGSRQAEEIGLDNFRALARRAQVPEADVLNLVSEFTRTMTEAWLEVRDRELLPDLVDHVDQRLGRHRLVSESP